MDNRAFTAPGEMILVDGSNYHVRRLGNHGNQGPLVVLECGLSMMSSCWGWIAPDLGQFAQVITYDRAGLGWSGEREGVRDIGQLAFELRHLLDVIAPGAPIVLAGHSMGAMVNRAFFQAAPDRVKAMVWLDPAHPEQFRRPGIRRRMRHLVFYIEAAQMLASKGVPAIEIPLMRHLSELPEKDLGALRRFLRNPTHLRICAREARGWEASAQAIQSATLGSLPLLLISGKKGALPGWEKLQQELATLSSNVLHKTFPEVSHISMLANPEHAKKVVAEIRGFLENLHYDRPS